MRALVAICLLGCTAVSIAQTEPAASRFSGSGILAAPVAESVDQRFVISAKLQANHTQSSDRFVVNARLIPDPKSATAACGPLGDGVFSDGFEDS